MSDPLEFETVKEIESLLTEKYLNNRIEFWKANNELAIEIELFRTTIEEIIKKVAIAAVNRRMDGKPSMSEQDWKEQLLHCEDHIDLWRVGDKGDEDSTDEQAKHALCRAMLAYFCYVSNPAN